MSGEGQDRAGQDRWARVAWSRLAEPGDLMASSFVAEHGAHEAWLRVTEQGEGPSRWRVRLGEVDPGRDLEIAHKLGARVLVPGDEDWPHRLSDLGPATPFCLWARGPGRLAEVGDRSVSIVGCRASSPYGEHVTASLSAGCAEAGVTVVSGGAFGIDAGAHRAALAVGGPTIAVLACGIDRFYPRAHEHLLRTVADTGAVLTEVPPGSAPTRWRFLERNRLIAALSPVTVVVEAAWRSGALATANRAANLGRVVAAVPGPVTSATSAGCHALLRDGAVCVTDVAEVLELIGPGQPPAAGDGGRGEAREHDGLDDVQLRVFDALALHRGVAAASIARVSGLDARAVWVALAQLEAAGRVRQRDGLWTRAPRGR